MKHHDRGTGAPTIAVHRGRERMTLTVADEAFALLHERSTQVALPR